MNLGSIDCGDELLALLLEKSGQGLLIAGGDGRIRSVDAHAASLLGLTVESLQFLPLTAVLGAAAATLPGTVPLRILAAAGGRPLRAELHRLRPDVVAVLLGEPPPERTEAALRKAEEQLRATIETTPDVAIQWFDEQGRVLLWNHAAERMFGFTAAEAMGRTLDQLIHTPEEAAAFLVTLQQIEATGRPFGPAEYQFRRRDHSIGTCLSTLFAIPGESSSRAFVCMDVDISERKAIETELRRSEARLRQAQALAGLGIWEWDPTVDRTEWSGEMFRIYGIAEADFTGRVADYLSATHAEDYQRMLGEMDLWNASAIRAARTRGLVGGQTLELRLEPMEYRILRPDGSVIWVRTDASATVGAGGVMQRIFGTMCDITAAKRAEEMLRQAQKLESIGRLAGGVAHDFNNLLTSIIGFSELARSRVGNGSQEARCLDRVLEAAGRGATLTEQLLAYARRKVITPEVIGLDIALERFVPVLHPLLGDSIVVAVEPGAPGVAVRVDPGGFEQVLMNLVVNARDAMPAGGSLRLVTRVQELGHGAPAVLIDLPPGSYAVLEVVDAGAGMDEEVLRRAFEPFFTTKAVGKGTGLGLATCYGIVRQAGGSIVLDSKIGQGTTAQVYLPLHRGETTTPPLASVRPAPPRGSEQVLFVEDDGLVREMVTQALRDLGYQVHAAPDGEAALRCAAGMTRVDLLISDVVMPRLGGRQLADQLRRNDPALPVIFASGYAEDAIVQDGVLPPGVQLLLKPYTMAQLAAKVRSVLDGGTAPTS